MKQPLLFATAAWGIFVIEAARADFLPPGVLLLPVVVVGMLWCRSAAGLFVGGAVLVLDGIIHPQPLPLIPVLLTFISAILVSARTVDDGFNGHGAFRHRVPEWMQIILLTSFGLLLLTLPAVTFDQATLADQWMLLRRYIVIAIPASFLLACLVQLGDEFGMRRSTTI